MPNHHRTPSNLFIIGSIVAVHGIGANRDFTWKRTGGRDWLEDADMLIADLPHSRIMTFGYESSWFGKDSVAARLDAIASQLRDLLEDARRVRNM